MQEGVISVWKYKETNAYDSISLHDCRTDDIRIEGKDLVVNFPDGFWITPVSKHIKHDRPLKTGPSQLRFICNGVDCVVDSIDLYKTAYLFRKPIFCKRIQYSISDFLSLINSGKYELEFIYEYHQSFCALYKCWIWRNGRGMAFECQIELTAKSIEYCWNEIRKAREW